jgi:hypothetical protein
MSEDIIRKRIRRAAGAWRTPVVIAKCVGCGAVRDIRAGEIPADDMPMCGACGMPMIAERAETGNNDGP